MPPATKRRPLYIHKALAQPLLRHTHWPFSLQRKVAIRVNVRVRPRMDGGCPTALEAHCGCSLNPEGEQGRERQVSYRSGPLHCFVWETKTSGDSACLRKMQNCKCFVDLMTILAKLFFHSMGFADLSTHAPAMFCDLAGSASCRRLIHSRPNLRTAHSHLLQPLHSGKNLMVLV